MSRLKRMLAALKPDPKREFPVIYVYTFQTGERLYTYKPEDYGKIGSRYNRNIQEATNYLQTFALTEKEWGAAIVALKDNNRKAIRGEMDMVEALMDANSTYDWFLSKVNGLKNANETILEFIFCMFYLLEDERATGYNKAYNDKKIALLNTEPEMRDFFLDSLKQNIKTFLPTSKEDTLMLLLEMMKMKGALTFMNMPADTTN